MKRFNIFVLFLCLSNIIFSKNSLNQLFKDFRTSIELPYYYKSKVLNHKIADILDVSIADGKIIFKYVMPGDWKKNERGYYNYEEKDMHLFTVEIDIVKSKVKKGEKSYDNRVWIENNDGITITDKIKDEPFKDTFLMNWFILETNSQALKDKLYNEINKSFAPYYPKPKKFNRSKSQDEIVVPKTISNKYIQ